MKKSIKSFLIFSSLFALVGCGNPAPTETPTEAPTDTPTEVPTETPTVAPTETPTETPTVAPDPIPEDNKVHLYIIAGQSGARGKALASDLDRRETVENKEVQILADGYTMPALSDIAESPSANATFKNMAATFGDNASEFGPELGLAKALTARYPRNDDGEYRSAIIKYTACGSTFYDHWYSESAYADPALSFNTDQIRVNEKLGKEVGPLTNNYYQLIDKGIEHFEENGFDVVIDGVIFSHGEQDAKFDVNMEVYEKTLEYFIQDTRNYLGDENIPFIITEALTNSAKYSNDLRDIQARVAEKTNSILLHSDDLYQNTFEPWHLGARSNVILGERAGAELIAKKDNRVISYFNVEETVINVQINTRLGLPSYLTAVFEDETEALVPVRWDDSFNPTETGTVSVKAIAEYNTHVFEEEIEINVINEPTVNGHIEDPMYGKETKLDDNFSVKFAKGENGLYIAAKANDNDIWTDGEQWKIEDMGQMGVNDDLRVYVTDSDSADDRYSIFLSSTDVFRVYTRGFDTSSLSASMPSNNLNFKNELPNCAHRTLTKGVVNGGECSEITWEMFISYEDLGIDDAESLKLFVEHSDISSADGTGADRVETVYAFAGATNAAETDIANYLSINDLI